METALEMAIAHADEALVHKLLSKGPPSFRHPEHLLQVVLKTQQWRFALHAPKCQLLKTEFLVHVMDLTQSVGIVETLAAHVRSRRSVMLAACRVDPMVLRLADDKLRNDQRLVVTATARCGLALQYASARLRAKPDVVLLAAHPNVNALRYCSHALLDNEGFASAAIHRCGGECLQFFSHRLRGDVGVVTAAVRACGLSLSYARPLLWSDLWVVSAAVQQNGAALLVAGERLRDDDRVVRLALQSNGLALRGASARLRDHPEFVELAVRQQAVAMEAASPRLADDYAFMRRLVAIDGDVLAFASPRLRSDRSLALAAVASAKFAFELHHLKLDTRLLGDDEIRIEMALRNHRHGIAGSVYLLTQEFQTRIANGMTADQIDGIAALCGSFAARLPRKMDDDACGPLRLLQDLDAPFGPLRAHRQTNWEDKWEEEEV